MSLSAAVSQCHLRIFLARGILAVHMVWLTHPVCTRSLPSLIFWLWPQLNVGSWWQKTIHAFAVATLTVGSLLQGVVEIYGTTNHLIIYYFWAGAGLLVVNNVWVSSPARIGRTIHIRTHENSPLPEVNELFKLRTALQIHAWCDLRRNPEPISRIRANSEPPPVRPKADAPHQPPLAFF